MGLLDRFKNRNKQTEAPQHAASADTPFQIASALPHFKYHPNAYENGTFSKKEDGGKVVCQCCNNETEYFYETMYCKQKINCLCPSCIASGDAAERFNGVFVQDAETEAIDNAEKSDELFKKTPGYVSWQGEHWLACCNDFCAFIGDTNAKELRELGVLEEVIADFEAHDGGYDDTLGCLENGVLCAYLFQCLHCGKYRIWIDAD